MTDYVLVEWLDSHGFRCGVWVDHEDAVGSNILDRHTTIGIIIAESEHAVTLAGSWISTINNEHANNQVSGLMTIPKVAILRRSRLEEVEVPVPENG